MPTVDQMIDPSGVGDDNWKIRRRLLFFTTLFHMFIITFCVVRNSDTELARSVTSFCTLALSGNVGAYVFGVSWEELSMAKRGLVKPNSSFVRSADENHAPEADPHA